MLTLVRVASSRGVGIPASVLTQAASALAYIRFFSVGPLFMLYDTPTLCGRITLRWWLLG